MLRAATGKPVSTTKVLDIAIERGAELVTVDDILNPAGAARADAAE